MPVAVWRFPFEDLPKDAHGTGGTLGSKHRVVFNHLKTTGYDICIAQEDNLMVKSHNLAYFADWSQQTVRTGYYHPPSTFLIPPPSSTFLIFEIVSKLQERRQISSRHSTILGLGGGGGLALQLSKVENVVWVQDQWNPALLHMLNREMVANFTASHVDYHTDRGMWSKPARVDDAGSSYRNGPNNTWEYNPWFTTYWLRSIFRTAVHICEIARSLLHHGSNRYVDTSFGTSRRTLLGLTALELEDVVHACTGDSRVYTGDLQLARSFRPIITFHGDTPTLPCESCFRAGKSAQRFVNYPPPNRVDWESFF